MANRPPLFWLETEIRDGVSDVSVFDLNILHCGLDVGVTQSSLVGMLAFAGYDGRQDAGTGQENTR